MGTKADSVRLCPDYTEDLIVMAKMWAGRFLKEENEKTVKRFLASPAGSAFEIVPIGAQGTPFFKTPFDTGADLHFAALLQKKR